MPSYSGSNDKEQGESFLYIFSDVNNNRVRTKRFTLNLLKKTKPF